MLPLMHVLGIGIISSEILNSCAATLNINIVLVISYITQMCVKRTTRTLIVFCVLLTSCEL